ncbi:PREDICTED: UPF0704 protein C6orf165 homolog [Thamnophis sirtalis]|uniref:Cilia- and flagella-associated protein 206 n=1 Tax=Thamnophis sirtalis TaxID=35019 RepID=A0A6I9YI43_9SAUR|nr:PREDICTED: UPF0704 protein C6orf165 homolog [Thamnophis sirtalis]
MSHCQAENVIKNIIREIGQECAMKGQNVTETLVAFMLEITYFNSVSFQLCVERLLDVKNPSLNTIKMQVYFDMNYTNRVELIREQHRVLDSRLAPVSREITDNRARTREELESVYRKIVSYVLLRSGLGSPTDIKVIREATAALQSVFPQTELAAFLSLSKKEKEQQLKELTMIVTGIRLFNKDNGKGGEGIDDLPMILNEAIPAASHHIDVELHASQHLAYRYTALIEMMHQSRNGDVELGQTMLKEALYNVRQHEAFLCIILSDVITCAQEVELMQKEFAAEMEQINNIVKSKTAVPTSLVYEYLSQRSSSSQPAYQVSACLWDALPSLKRPDKIIDCACERNPSIGVLKHKERYYSFNSKEAAYMFAKRPDKYIKMIAEKAKECAELIQLLELHHQFEYLAPYSQFRMKEKHLLQPISKSDCSTQTDTHILPPTIVKNYEWNEWELRRKAIKLANLRQKLTHSMQTNLSHMRRDNCSQVYLLKDSGTQTKRENSSNVPKPQIFLAGLRGGTPPITRMTKVNLTRAVDET